MPRDALRIVICDDSPAYVGALRAFLERDPALRVAGSFGRAEDMLPELARLAPDLITMDLEMPGMGGLAGIRRIMDDQPRPILVLSAHTGKRSERTAEALAAGALEAMAKDSLRLVGPDDVWATAVRSRVKRLATVRLPRHRGPARPRGPAAAVGALDRPARVVGIGASTGGPPALARVLGALPASFPLPVLVVQHIAPGFGPGLVTWLARHVALPVAVAQDGARATRGIWFAPDDAHLRLDLPMRFAIDSETVRGAHRPSLDVLFESLAGCVRGGAVGVVLTGMGRDGAEGAGAIRRAGGLVVAQDEASSAVFGMPRAAIESGADAVLDLDAIGPALGALRLPAGAVA